MNSQETKYFCNELIEAFESFLEDRGIDVPNEEKTQSESPSTIYGTDYGELEDRLTEVLNSFDVPRTNDELIEYAGVFIEAFEDFLDQRGIEVPNDEKQDEPYASTIYGEDYTELENVVMDMLDAYEVINLDKIKANHDWNQSGSGDGDGGDLGDNRVKIIDPLKAKGREDGFRLEQIQLDNLRKQHGGAQKLKPRTLREKELEL